MRVSREGTHICDLILLRSLKSTFRLFQAEPSEGGSRRLMFPDVVLLNVALYLGLLAIIASHSLWLNLYASSSCAPVQFKVVFHLGLWILHSRIC